MQHQVAEEGPFDGLESSCPFCCFLPIRVSPILHASGTAPSKASLKGDSSRAREEDPFVV